MIRVIDKYTCAAEDVPFEAWNCIDTETKMLMNEGAIKNEVYYVCHNGKDSDRYKRVVALKYIDICQTDKEDNLSRYGFKLIGQKLSGLNWWMRK